MVGAGAAIGAGLNQKNYKVKGVNNGTRWIFNQFGR